MQRTKGESRRMKEESMAIGWERAKAAWTKKRVFVEMEKGIFERHLGNNKCRAS